MKILDIPQSGKRGLTVSPVAVQNLVITNVGGLVALGLTCPGDPGDNTVVRASAPQSLGR